MRYSQQKITKSDRTIALFSSLNVISFNKTNEKTFSFFYFHIDIKKYRLRHKTPRVFFSGAYIFINSE